MRSHYSMSGQSILQPRDTTYLALFLATRFAGNGILGRHVGHDRTEIRIRGRQELKSVETLWQIAGKVSAEFYPPVL